MISQVAGDRDGDCSRGPGFRNFGLIEFEVAGRSGASVVPVEYSRSLRPGSSTVTLICHMALLGTLGILNLSTLLTVATMSQPKDTRLPAHSSEGNSSCLPARGWGFLLLMSSRS